jgi:hypothetical protein
MRIAQYPPEADEPQHIPYYVQAAVHISLADPQFIEPAEGRQSVTVLDEDLNDRLPFAETIGTVSP